MRERITESDTVVKGTPSKPAIKFCGIRRSEDAAIANFLQPDYVGFVFWAKSKRAVTVGEAKALRAMMSRRITTVGVFVDAEVAVIAMLYTEGVISVAQLQGHEDADYIARLREAAPGIVTWKAQQVRSAADIDAANASPADFVMLESGFGDEEFDWSLLDAMQRPFALSGSLNPENVASRIVAARPSLVDVSDGIEAEEEDTLDKACKDEAKMRAFYRNVKRATKVLAGMDELDAMAQDLQRRADAYESPYAAESADSLEDSGGSCEAIAVSAETDDAKAASSQIDNQNEQANREVGTSGSELLLERFEDEEGHYLPGALTQTVIELEELFAQHGDDPTFKDEFDQLSRYLK